ncbi:MAG: hypothetical protein N3B11_05005 [Coriobacteriia bacterium]|nr:hypothetical protein [Coriobacteriia bacterium]
MSSCPHIGTCHTTSDEAGFSPEFARIIRTAFCRADFRSCARYRMAQVVGDPSGVPENLLPTEPDVA